MTIHCRDPKLKLQAYDYCLLEQHKLSIVFPLFKTCKNWKIETEMNIRQFIRKKYQNSSSVTFHSLLENQIGGYFNSQYTFDGQINVPLNLSNVSRLSR